MSSETTILLLPGLGNSDPEHWQSHWERGSSTFQRLVQDEWNAPDRRDWVAKLDQYLAKRTEPVILAAHSSACAMAAHWASTAPPEHLSRVQGALLVAPSDPDEPNYPLGPTYFSPMPLHRLPFPTTVVASTNDECVSPDRARQYAAAWGSRFVLLEGAGHINAASAFGPWPAGLALLHSLSPQATGITK